ncbi:MAG: anaerobic ribonucleoside-triphosphate reductase [Methyloversatilis sp.]|jgi:hypothetical protein|uniref:anaerobic ribonucleoside-triphosphate reductase n=1 Tax=Methyloversatilis discipulorum TaxID=1119528 RepID=UPI0025D4DC72|nr:MULTISPECIES: anaerobic ribonucleoside-triphosphate reductase [Methyloversatilis]MCR6665313.1 anaerobic ribonucleoside-triphosphate reductase [Methyloversatilis sp.]
MHATQPLHELAGQTTAMLRDDERQRCEVWTRVMGYHRPVASFNIGKQGEHTQRRFFVEQADAG